MIGVKSSNRELGHMLKQIPFIDSEATVTPIKEGYSEDQKYIIANANHRYVLRLFPIHQYDRKKSEFDVLRQMETYQVRCSRPLELNKLKGADLGYMIVPYIEGEDAKTQLEYLSDPDQFQIGLEAGEELRKMHQYKAPSHIKPWHDRKVKKHQKYVDAYWETGVRITHDQEILSFIEENITYMKRRPNLFQHDDFHLGNLIVKNNKLAGVIDFGLHDWGDPIHEFLKVGLFSRQESIPFSIGQISGYHGKDEPPDSFWRLYSLYLAMSLFSSIVWTLKMRPDELDEMISKIETIIEDHDSFTDLKPTWYTG